MKVVLLHPASNARSSGNAVTAQRWMRMLESMQHEVQYNPHLEAATAPDLLIALNPAKCGELAFQFLARFPEAVLVFCITGTDLHGSEQMRVRAISYLEQAKQIWCINPLSPALLPAHLQTRARVILPSSNFSADPKRETVPGKVVLAGHLRKEKDPFLVIDALALLPRNSPISVHHFGKALSPDFEQKAQRYSEEHANYQWFGEVANERVLEELQSAQALLISSVVEGAPGVIVESIAVGLPVLASNIAGCRGILGEEYSGYFPAGDSSALAACLSRLLTSAQYYEQLKKEILRLQPRHTEAQEKQSLAASLSAIASAGLHKN